jgi:hypothetical protein
VVHISSFFGTLAPPYGRLHIPLLPLSRTHCSRLLLQLLGLKCRPSNESTNSKHGYSNLTLPRQDACKQESTNRLRVSSNKKKPPTPMLNDAEINICYKIIPLIFHQVASEPIRSVSKSGRDVMIEFRPIDGSSVRHVISSQLGSAQFLRGPLRELSNPASPS